MKTNKKLVESKIRQIVREVINENNSYDPDKIRTTMQGFVGKDFAAKANDEDLVQMANLKDKYAQVYNTYIRQIKQSIDKLRSKYKLPPSEN